MLLWAEEPETPKVSHVGGQEFRHEKPDRVVVGTVGEPGQRTFYLQARSAGMLTSVVLEKAQVAALADRLEEMLDSVVRRSGGQAPVPAVTSDKVDDLGPLDLPLEDEFRVGTLAMTWLAEEEQVEIIATEVGGDDTDEDTPDQPSLTIRLGGSAARAFISRARAVVSAGRAPCPLCAQPLDPSGHVCPRQNGFHRRS
jgi:uncharacterized repeat protein (TIGR03847 family)